MTKGFKVSTMNHRLTKISAERGVALLIVLWIIASAALVVSSLNAAVRSGASFVASEVKLTKMEALLDAGAEIAATRLIDEDEVRRWLPDGRPRGVTFLDAELTITISDPNGLIDLNKADKDLLLGFFGKFTGSESEAGRLRNLVLRARGEALNGQKKAQQRKKGRRRNLSDILKKTKEKSGQSIAFIDIAQLRSLAGMTRELYQRVAPFVTVYGRDGRINPQSAPIEVLSSIPKMTKTDIARLQVSRKAGFDEDATLTEIKRRVGAYLSDQPGPAYIVSVQVRRPGYKHAGHSVFVIATGLDNNAPYRLISKRPASELH